MKKSLLCIAAVLTVALTLPAAAFASDIQPWNTEGTATVSEDSDIWLPVTEEILAEEAMITAAAASDPSIIIDDESGSGTVTADAGEDLAGGDAGIAPMSVLSSYIGATRYSSTSGNISASASFDRKATSASCTITLQEKYNGSWRTATNVPVKIYKKTVSSANTISASRTFTLVKGTVYRAKICFIDKNSTGTYYKT
ncbi:MAG: hypothetical protein ACI4LD_08255, partial [Lentihominibacter sp.]